MTKNKKLNIVIYIYLIFFIALISLLIFNNKIPCPFKYIFKIPCPFCGTTRSFKELFKGNITNALYFNFLTIPLLLFILYFLIIFIKDIVKNETKSLELLKRTFTKYYILIIILLIISEIFNIIHKI